MPTIHWNIVMSGSIRETKRGACSLFETNRLPGGKHSTFEAVRPIPVEDTAIDSGVL